ncbi:MAG: 30S ribosomal protein S16 [Ignavibacteriales bacterium]|nr:30S ribosomal protein S16 [Ignavibacteriales bacterium]
MAVKIRLQRGGKKKQPIYRIVAADGRYKRDGRFLEKLGNYNPNIDPVAIDLKESRVMYWLGVGATPTDTVRNLLSRKGIMLKWYLKKKGKDEATVAAEFEKWQASQPLKREKELAKKARRKILKKKAKSAAPKEAAPAAAPAPEAPVQV